MTHWRKVRGDRPVMLRYSSETAGVVPTALRQSAMICSTHTAAHTRTSIDDDSASVCSRTRTGRPDDVRDDRDLLSEREPFRAGQHRCPTEQRVTGQRRHGDVRDVLLMDGDLHGFRMGQRHETVALDTPAPPGRVAREPAGGPQNVYTRPAPGDRALHPEEAGTV